MADKALLLGLRREVVPALVGLLAKMNLEPMLDDWRSFSPRAWRGRNRPIMLLADADNRQAPSMAGFCREIRRLWGEPPSLLVVTSEQKLSRLAEMLDAGADACLPASGPIRLWERKISRRLAGSRIPTVSELTEEIPVNLLDVFYGGAGLIRLGDVASIHPGASPRLNRYRRMAPPESGWRGTITSDAIERFQSGRPTSYLSWNRLHLFRLPLPEEYDVAEKVLLRRVGPPLIATVDRSRLPAGTDVYSIVPGEGVEAGYIACLLNSRLLDFYFNRLAKNGSDGRLRLDDLRNAPVPKPTARGQVELKRAASLLSYFGPQPRIWIDQQTKDETWERMENVIFELYGAGHAVRDELATMHF
ncbi:MAG: hypothetical protein LBU23_12405 [Planctomycetota bacterium]|jgi:hypothetical protein|nr:hypothetical protein [Planctomycetota bacterium]